VRAAAVGRPIMPCRSRRTLAMLRLTWARTRRLPSGALPSNPKLFVEIFSILTFLINLQKNESDQNFFLNDLF
jgi:hypothetical protein